MPRRGSVATGAMVLSRQAFSPTTGHHNILQDSPVNKTKSAKQKEGNSKERASRLNARRNDDVRASRLHTRRDAADGFAPQGKLKRDSQFQEELDCKYCGSAHITSIREGLTSTERRKLATRAVAEITKLRIRHRDMKLLVTDRGMGGVCEGKENDPREVFHEESNQIQYLLAGRRTTASNGNPPNTYVLLFSGGTKEKKHSVCHLLKFSSEDSVMALYHATHRMLRDNMFKALFDIEGEGQQDSFDPEQVQKDMEKVEAQISNLLLNDMTKASSKAGGEREINMMMGDENLAENEC